MDPEKPAENQPPAVTEESAPSTETQETVTETEQPTTETPSTETTETPTETTEATTKGSEPKKIVRELISTRKRAQTAEERAHYLEVENRVLKGLQSGTQQQTQQPVSAPASGPPTPPDPDEFEGGRYSDEYETAYHSYQREQVKYDLKQEQEQDRQKEATRKQQESFKERETRFQERIETAAEEDPELLTITQDNTLPLSFAMGIAVKESDISPKLLRYLHEHRDEAKNIFDMAPSWLDHTTGQIMQTGNPLAAARAIGRLEAKLATPPASNNGVTKTKIVTAAPEPVRTVTEHTGGPAIVQLDDQTPTSDWIKERNRREAAARRPNIRR